MQEPYSSFGFSLPLRSKTVRASTPSDNVMPHPPWLPIKHFLTRSSPLGQRFAAVLLYLYNDRVRRLAHLEAERSKNICSQRYPLQTINPPTGSSVTRNSRPLHRSWLEE